jgi:hypothetical protein
MQAQGTNALEWSIHILLVTVRLIQAAEQTAFNLCLFYKDSDM